MLLFFSDGYAQYITATTNSKHFKDNPGKEFIGIVEETGEQVPVISKKREQEKKSLRLLFQNNFKLSTINYHEIT